MTRQTFNLFKDALIVLAGFVVLTFLAYTIAHQPPSAAELTRNAGSVPIDCPQPERVKP